MWLFLAVPWVSLQFVIVVFPDHIHFLFLFGYSYLQRMSNMVISKKIIIFQGFRGGPSFFQEVQLFSREMRVQRLISVETHILCYFPGGGGRPPYPPSRSAQVGLHCLPNYHLGG